MVDVTAEIEAAFQRAGSRSDVAVMEEVRALRAELPIGSARDTVLERLGKEARRQIAVGLSIEALHKMGLALGDSISPNATVNDMCRLVEESDDPEAWARDNPHAFACYERAMAFVAEAHRLQQEIKGALGQDGHLS